MIFAPHPQHPSPKQPWDVLLFLSCPLTLDFFGNGKRRDISAFVSFSGRFGNMQWRLGVGTANNQHHSQTETLKVARSRAQKMHTLSAFTSTRSSALSRNSISFVDKHIRMVMVGRKWGQAITPPRERPAWLLGKSVFPVAQSKGGHSFVTTDDDYDFLMKTRALLSHSKASTHRVGSGTIRLQDRRIVSPRFPLGSPPA